MIQTRDICRGNLIFDVLYSQGTQWKLENQSIDQISLLLNIHIMQPTALVLFTHDSVVSFHESKDKIHEYNLEKINSTLM